MPFGEDSFASSRFDSANHFDGVRAEIRAEKGERVEKWVEELGQAGIPFELEGPPPREVPSQPRSLYPQEFPFGYTCHSIPHTSPHLWIGIGDRR